MLDMPVLSPTRACQGENKYTSNIQASLISMGAVTFDKNAGKRFKI